MFGAGKKKQVDAANDKNKKEEDHLPRWLEPENDDAIREEVAPLFGTGSLSLQDDDDETKKLLEGKQSDEKKKKKSKSPLLYGAIGGGAKDEEFATTSQNDNDDLVKKVLIPIDPEALKPHRPNMNACLWMFHLLEGISVTASVCLLVTQIIPFFQNPDATTSTTTMSILEILLKIYISLFCVLFILTETQAPIPSIRNSPILQVYLSRGFLYSFVGLICVEEAYSERVKEVLTTHHDEFYVGWYAIFMDVSSGFMLLCGIVYMMLGLCCLKRLRDRIKQQEIDAWKQYRIDMKAWDEKYGV